MSHYLSISHQSESLFKDRGSKFIGIAVPVKTDDDLDKAMAAIKKIYHDARHHCYAFRMNADHSYYRYSDDGEPNNSAGPPIYGQIQSLNLTNVLVVVVRYFGGTKLGVGGLINAYREAAKMALETATIITHTIKAHYLIDFPYDKTGQVMRIIDSGKIDIINQEFNDICRLRFAIEPDKADRTLAALGLIAVDYKWLETK